jgi:hypothetical protein
MTHAWCSDPARDAAVRAAEDNRTGPLPTLAECIDGMFPKSGSATSAQEQENKGDDMATNGLRVERVTLEIRHYDDNDSDSVYRWNWAEMMSEQGLGINESVRVVDAHAEAVADSVAWEGARDAYLGRMARLTDERDAAIREREESRQVAQTFKSLCLGEQARNKALRARVSSLEEQLESVACRAATAENRVAELEAARITQSLTADRFADAVQEADTLRARVDELEARDDKWQAENAEAFVRLQKQFDEEWNGTAPAAPAASGAAGRFVGSELAGRLQRFNDRVRSGEIQMPQGPPKAVQAASGYVGDGVVLECDDCGKRFWLDDTSGGSHRMLEPDNAFGGELWETYCPVCTIKAASGGGDHFADASKMVEQPRGWLTEEERLALDAAKTILDGGERTNIGVTIDALLARSTPPEVVLPTVFSINLLEDRLLVEAHVKEALAAAGVPVKEVGRE